MGKHMFVLFSDRMTPAELSRERKAALRAAKRYGLLRVAGEVEVAFGGGYVSSGSKIDGEYFQVELDTDAEAVAFVAEANGQTIEEVERATAEQGRMMQEYIRNLKAASKKVGPRKRAHT